MKILIKHSYRGYFQEQLSGSIVLVLVFVLASLCSRAQNVSNRGTDFWVGYGHHQFMEQGTNDMNMVLYLSAEDQPATVTVTIDSSGLTVPTWWRKTYTIPAYTVIASDIIPKGVINVPAAAGDPLSDPNYDARLFTDPPPAGTGGAGVFRKKGIHITSNVPIVAYAHIYGSTSSGATMLLPVTAWGYSYVSLNSRQSYASNCYNWMYVIASKDNTVIQVTPKVQTRAQNLTGLTPNGTTTITLMKGQIYQVIGANDGADANGNGGTAGTGKDLSGTIVRSMANGANDCYPIAVFAGSSRTANPASCGSGGGDNDNQQLFPQHAWGKKYLTAPFSGSATANSFARSTYKVAVRDPATVVTVNGAPIPSPLLGGNYYIYESSTADLIEADKPIEVMQFMTGGGCLGNGGLGDPEMVVLSPVEQAIKSVGFFRNNKESISVNYCTLIVPTAGLTSLKFCGNPTWNHSYAHPGLAGYTVVIKRWDSPLPPAAPLGQCLVTCDSAFTGITYGLGNVESYAFNIGTYLNNLNAVGSVHNEPDTTNGGKNSHKFTCVNTPVKLSALIRYQPLKLVWNISSLGAVVTPNTDVTQDPASAAFDGTETVNGITYYKYTLPGTYTFNTPGTYTIPIRSTSLSLDNCNNTEELKISVEVKPRPTADFTFLHPTGCVKDTVAFTGPASTGSYTIGQWKWTFADGSKDSVQNPHKALVTAGTQNINLAVVTADGCVADVTKSITVYAPPVTTLTAAPTTICEGGSVTFSETSSYGGPVPVNSWYWDLGNSTIINATNGNQQTATYTAYGTYTAKHVVKVSALCVSDTAQAPVTVYANPQPGFSYPAGCLPDNGIVQFTDTTKVPDGQTLSSWSWNFGDANATPANPNTSTLQNPLHTYSFGNYTIQFSVTTANGCTKNITVPATFSLRPKLNYPALSAVCANINSSISVATASVSNGVPGTGVYSGPGTTSAGSFTPSTAGAGTHTITYTFTTTAGCVESITSSITVYPKPTASFMATADICLGESALITDQSTIASGAITSWRWNFGDATWKQENNGNAFSHTWSIYNTYSVKLVAVSDQGCISDTATRLVTVHPLPVTDFSLPAAVCMPGGLAEFKNATTVADQSALSYTWDFGDNSAVSHAKDGNHTYAASGSYTIQLNAVSAFGCANAVSKNLSSFFDKPIAAFTVTPDTLCQGSDNVFHDESTNSLGTITQWSWNFGDGTTSTERNPTKRYQQPGNYTVKLNVTNNANCISQAATKQVVVYLQPVIDAGPSFTVPQGTVVQFNPTANDSTSLSFIWAPGTGLSDPNKLRPLLQAMVDETYTLTATGEGQCTASDFLKVKILKPVDVPNAFSPNGDGVHDTWNITNLSDYPGCTVAIFNRYGQRVYYSVGYGTPWNGTVAGKPLPMATYYYVIHLKNGFPPLSGSITIIR